MQNVKKLFHLFKLIICDILQAYEFAAGSDLSVCSISSVYSVRHPSESGSSVSSSRCMLKRLDGSLIFVTPQREQRRVPNKSLNEKYINLLKLSGIVCIFLFPPFGVAAFIYALITEKDYILAKNTGDFTRARKNATTCERLLILSILCSVLIIVIIIVLINL